MASFTDHYNVISIDRLSSKTKIGKVSWCLILFYVSQSSSPLQSCFKENAKILSKNSTTQEIITISRQSRSSRPEMFIGKDVLKKCRKFTGEHPCRSAISIKLLANLLKLHFRMSVIV